jgi:Ni,Fe-hydrogenase III small subunit/ferredoxin
MPWAVRGLRRGVVTTAYPRKRDDYGPDFHATVSLRPPSEPGATRDPAGTDAPGGSGPSRRSDPSGDVRSAEVCPTGALHQAGDGSELRLDRGRCIVCGRCVDAHPERVAFDPTLELASVGRAGLVVPATPETEESLAALRRDLGARSRAFGRSLHIRHVDAGSDGSEEWEVAALTNPVYDIHRLGLFFTASPRHADLLLVTGVGTAGMAEPLRRTYEAMPAPRIVLAAGSDAVSGGLHTGAGDGGLHTGAGDGGLHTGAGDGGLHTGAGDGRVGVAAILPVDVFVPGSPPSPFSLLHGILLALGRMGPGRSTA